MDLSKHKRVHFIGIGGISMSGLAEILLSRGHEVSGSDSAASELTARLVRLGARVSIGQRPENITPDIGLVAYTAAVGSDNPELVAAKALHIETIDRAHLLGMIMAEYDYAVCVAGTHGKTTTTSMIAEAFIAAGRDPTVTVGGILPSIGGNIRLGASHTFIAEACEYHDSFLKFSPYVAVVLNVEHDHVDYFKDLAQMAESFRRFAQNIRPGGALVIHADIPCLRKITQGLEQRQVRVVTYGSDSADVSAKDIRYNDNGCAGFTPVYNGVDMPRMQLSVPGAHNVDNALAAMAAARCLGVADAADALERYTGTQRRFEKKGGFSGVTVIDDYAHHPTEIRATLAAAKRTQHSRLWCVFQPHTYSRTHEMLDALAHALTGADEVVVVDIYAARERDTGLVHARDLALRVTQLGTSCRYISGFANVEKFLSGACMPNDMLITMGAGDVYFIGEALVAEGY